jgi:hypothetical protein
MLFHKHSHQGSHIFEEGTISPGEGRRIVAVDVDLASDVNGHNDLRLGLDRAGKQAT